MSSSNLDKKDMIISFAKTKLVLDPSGALYWPLHNALVIADLHLEKGSYYAQRGNPIPLYDTFDTLTRLAKLIRIYKPQTVIALGDNIHDVQAFLRMSRANNSLLETLSLMVEKWIWLMGNHDKKTIPLLSREMFFYQNYQLDSILFSHNREKNKPFQIIGHYHPQTTFKAIKGKCFVAGKNTLVMPSFGTYTGGLNINSSGFKKAIAEENYKVYLLQQNKVWRIL